MRRWKNYIETDLEDICWAVLDRVHLFRLSFGSCEHGNEQPWGSTEAGNFLNR
jgi:hypothetical protein